MHSSDSGVDIYEQLVRKEAQQARHASSKSKTSVRVHGGWTSLPSSHLSTKHFLQDMNKSMGNAVEFNININVNVSVMQCAMCSFWLHVLHGWCQNEAAEKYMKPAEHGVCAIFVVQQQLLLLRQQKPKLQMGFYCCCCCFSTSFFAIQFINMDNGFGNWSVKCALLIRRTGRTSSHPNGETISDLGHFIMPFTCLHTHTCAECVLHKLHITHTPRRRFFLS